MEHNRIQMLTKLDVRFGSKADIAAFRNDVRFTPESGHVRCTSACLLWANSGHCVGTQFISPTTDQPRGYEASNRDGVANDRVGELNH
jgi:hypothetical protein